METWVRVFSALLTPTIALVATYIAVQQYKLARLKMRHELFERRVAVYKAVVEYLTTVVRYKSSAEDSAVKMMRDTADGRFIFKEDVVQYLEELFKKGIDLSLLNEELGEPDLEKDTRKAKATERGNLKKWFAEQYTTTYEKFKKYLALTAQI